MRHVHLQLPLTIKEKLHVTEKLNFAGMYKGFFRGVLFNKEIDQTRLEVQLSRGKIELSEITLRIWIFFNFLFELPSDSFSFFQFFFCNDYVLLQFLRMEDVNVTKKKERKNNFISWHSTIVIN